MILFSFLESEAKKEPAEGNFQSEFDEDENEDGET